jgi:hypothetical protein
MPPYDSEADDILGEERMMDIAVLEAQVWADEQEAEWRKGFLGKRARPPKGNVNDTVQPTGGSIGQESPY